MGQMSAVMPEDNFDALIAMLKSEVTQEVHRAGNATVNRARQIIVRDDAIITGDLWRSVGVEFSNAGQSAEVYASMPYASFVHDGTENMEARPFFDEAIAEQTRETNARLAALAARIERGTK